MIDGLTLTAGDNGEPVIRDEQLGRALGLARPTDVRKLIVRWNRELGGCRATVAQPPGKGRRPVTTYDLTEAQALFVASKSEAAKGAEILAGLIRVFIEWRRQRAAPPAPVALPVDPVAAHGVRMGDCPENRADLARYCQMAAKASGWTVGKVHGLIRRRHRLSSPYYLGLLFWPAMRAELHEIALGLRPPPSALRLLRPANVRQLIIPGT